MVEQDRANERGLGAAGVVSSNNESLCVPLNLYSGRPGTTLCEDGCAFVVWAPAAGQLDLCLSRGSCDVTIPMQPAERGYWWTVAEAGPGCLYKFRLNGDKERPDPASLYQPEGVHGRSQVMDTRFAWTDAAWTGVPLEDYVIYELHVGAFTPQGTFDAVIPRLAELKELGVTAIEIMPIAQFPGARNWGYDGAYPYAVQASYGGPAGLMRLVNAIHAHGMAAILDVVYNHLGPEGNYLRDFAPYFTDRFQTPWGSAINFSAAHSDEVRRFFIENALYWITDFHFDALRLDAIHGIFDPSARPFLAELAAAVHARGGELGRRVHLIAESDSNDPAVVRPREEHGLGLDAQWSDDFHHSLHAALTGERDGYYADFGGVHCLARAYREGFVYTGQYSKHRGRRHGEAPSGIPAAGFVVCSQNHDQVGNRPLGQRLASLVTFEATKLAAGAVMLSPYLPLLFMGEEYAEPAPFLYFVDHSDPELLEAVRRGRRQEFEAFERHSHAPYPDDEQTFRQSRLCWELRAEGRHRVMLDYYRELLRLRREVPAFAHLSRDGMEVSEFDATALLMVRRWHRHSQAIFLFNASDRDAGAAAPPFPAGAWRKVLDSAGEKWDGLGTAVPLVLERAGDTSLQLCPYQFIVFVPEEKDKT